MSLYFPRLLFDNAVFHIINRGISRTALFKDEEDCTLFLNLLQRYKKKVKFSLFHYALMQNHIHLLLKIYQAQDLPRLIKSLTLSYTNRFHFKYKTSGYLWQGRYKSMLIEEDRYLLECGRYIERNPLEAGLAKTPQDYPWTSYRMYALGENNPLIDFNPAYLALSDDLDVRKGLYIDYVLSSRDKNNNYEFKDLSLYGSEGFKEKIKNDLYERRRLLRMTMRRGTKATLQHIDTK